MPKCIDCGNDLVCGMCHTRSVGGVQVACKKKRDGAIWVYVKDNLSVGLEGVPISGPGNKKSDDAGFAAFDPLAENTYSVNLDPLPKKLADEYHVPEPKSKSVPVAAGDIKLVTFQVKRRPTPKISADKPKIVIVGRDYLADLTPAVKRHRLPVKLSYEGDHDGVGELSSPSAADLKVYLEEDSTEAKTLPLTLNAEVLQPGKTVYVEAAKASSKNEGTELTLTLKGGTVPPKVDKATDKITCVELKLDIYKARPLDGAEPVLYEKGKQIKPGRSVIVQGSTDETLWSQRAKLVIHKASPEDFPGKLLLKAIDASVAVFPEDKEKPAAGQTALTGEALKFANSAIDKAKGKTLWVEGRSKSAKFGDTGWTVEVVDVPDHEGDRVTMTALQAELRIFKSKAKTATDPEKIADGDKVKKGRYLHKQNTDKDHGRAKLIVRRLEPVGFEGKLFLTCWDIVATPSYSETKSGSPKVKLFTAETAGSEEAFETDITHSASAAEDLKTLWVEGGANSSALIDTQIRLGVREVDNMNDRGSFTVVEFTKLKATIKSTPALTSRPGHPAPTDHTFENSAKYSEDFGDSKNPPLVIVRNGRSDIALEVTTIPAAPVDLDITWKAVRNTADHVSLGGETDLPTVTRDGADKRKATLDTNQKGSFHIRPYIDCNGVDEYSPKEPSIPLNLVLVDATVVQDNSAGFAANLTATLGGGILNVRNGTWPGSWAGSIGSGGAGMTMELVADVTGGGADGRLGLDKVFGGLINMLSDNQITLTYTEIVSPPSTGPAPTYTVRNRYVLNRPAATGSYGGTPMFKPGDPSPTLLVFPVLDTGRPGGGQGGESATMSRSGGWDTAVDRPVGKRYTLRCIDSPGRGFLLGHPDHGGAALTGVHYVQAFRANFCFWTNVGRNRGATGDACDRVYSAIRTMDWAAVGDWTITWTVVSSAWTQALVNTNPHTINVTNPATVSPINAANSEGVEVRPPSGITDAIAWVTS